jgi:biotin carboxyl carrier protein
VAAGVTGGTIHLEIGGRLRQVSLERLDAGNRFRFTIDGRTLEVSAVRVGAGAWSFLLPDGSQYRVAVTGTAAAGFTAHLSSGDVAVGLTRRHSRRRADAPDASGPARVESPMPARVVRVLGTVGQRVRAGQGLVVVEAMKMEHELRSPRDGVVADVLVGEGASVEAGAVLMIVE